jgi:hypothetical protein
VLPFFASLKHASDAVYTQINAPFYPPDGPLKVEVGDRATVMHSRVHGVRHWSQRNVREIANALHTRLLLRNGARLQLYRPMNRLSEKQIDSIQVPYYFVVSVPAPFRFDVQQVPRKAGVMILAVSDR